MNSLHVRSISKKIKNVKILKDINISLNHPCVIGIVGPNGSGKSTLFKIISGLIKPTSGEVLYNNVNINSIKKIYNRELGFIIENPSLYENMTGKMNLQIYQNFHQINDINYINKICDILNINYLEKKVKSYSQGMKQRLGIACAVVHKPNLVLLDEPNNSLDFDGFIDLRNLIEMLRNENKLILFASHLLSEVEKISDEIYLFKDGEVIDIIQTKKEDTNNLEEIYFERIK